MKRAVVCGAGGFLGRHIMCRLKEEGYNVCGIGRHLPDPYEGDEFYVCDLRYLQPFNSLFAETDEVWQLACEVGGLGYIFDGANAAEMLSNSSRINIAVLEACVRHKVPKVFFSSSACVYPGSARSSAEADAYPILENVGAHAFEKLFSERLYLSYAERYGFEAKIARFSNTYGPLCCWKGGREKSVAALCRKVAELPKEGGEIEMWGDGSQMRNFVHVDDAIEGAMRLMRSSFSGPMNVGCDEMVTIRDLVWRIADVAGKSVRIKPVSGQVGDRKSVV